MGIISNKSYTSELDIKQLTAPASQPVSLAEQKLFSRIDGTYEDSLIQMLINASTLKAEQFVRGGFLTRQWQQTEDAGYNQNRLEFNFGFNYLSFSDYALEIKNIKITAIDEVKFFNTENVATVISPTLYRLDRPDTTQPSRIVFNNESTIFDSTRYFTQYQIKYIAGWALPANVPDDIKIAIMATAQAWYENRETLNDLPMQAKEILRPYRIIEI